MSIFKKQEKNGSGPEKRDLALIRKIQPQGGITFKAGRHIESGSGYEICLSIYEYPARLNDYWLSNICNIRDTVTTVDISTEDTIEVKKNLNRSMKEQNMRYLSSTDFAERLDASQRYREMEKLYTEIQEMGEVVKLVKARIFVSDRSYASLEEKIKEICATLESNGFHPTININECREEWKSMFEPYKEQQETLFSVHGQPLQSLTVAGGNPFHFSSLEDPQGVVIGTMGSGKSTLLKKRFLARAIRGDFVRTFDISGEFTLLTRTLGGKVLKLDGAQGILNPLEILRSGETEGVSYMRHISKVSTIYRFLVGHDVPSGELLDFEDLLRELYEEWGLSPREAGAASEIRVTGLPAERYPIFSDLLTYIDRKIETMKNANYEGMAETLAEQHILSYDKIRKVVASIVQNYGDIFDGRTSIDNIADEQIVTFDMSSLKDMKAEIFDAQIFNMVSFCWDNCVSNGKVMKERHERGEVSWEDVVRFLIIIDESHRWINAQKPHALDQILVYLREARKYFGGILLASQSIRDFVPEGSSSDNVNKIKTVFELTQYKFLFHQDANVLPLIDQVFAGVLTQSQRDRISKLEIGQNILCISSDKNLEFKVYLTKEEEQLFAGGA